MLAVPFKSFFFQSYLLLLPPGRKYAFEWAVTILIDKHIDNMHSTIIHYLQHEPALAF